MDKMRTDFTVEEAKTFFEFMATDDSITRIVDPITQQVLDIEGKNSGNARKCESLWGRCERCENCTSLRALHSKGIYHKMELLQDETYWVTSRYMRVKEREYVAETVTNITETLVLDSNRLDEIGELIKNNNRLSMKDSLTGLYNRRFLDESFLPSLALKHKDGNPALSIAIIDLDDFKVVNDTYGHQNGDLLLKEAASFWKGCFDSLTEGRERLAIRFGGDEILIVARGMEPGVFINEMQRCYAQMPKVHQHVGGTTIPLNATFGIASSTEFSGDGAWPELFELADKRLYQGKTAKKSR